MNDYNANPLTSCHYGTQCANCTTCKTD